MTLNKNSQKNFDVDTLITSTSMPDLLIEKGLDLYAHYVEPKLSKENIFNAVAGSVSFSTYYGAVPLVVQSDQAVFIKRTGVAIGFNVVNILATPVIAQFVESFAEKTLLEN